MSRFRLAGQLLRGVGDYGRGREHGLEPKDWDRSGAGRKRDKLIEQEACRVGAAHQEIQAPLADLKA